MQPIINFGRHVLNQIENGITKEWIETNGLGAYAMGTIVGINTRRQHALYVATRDNALKRSVMVNRVEESILIRGRRVDFASQEYPGTVSPQGYLYLENFAFEPFPSWVFALEDLKLEKRFFLRTGEETAVLVYKHLVGPTIKLILRPFLSCRDHNLLIREDNRFQNAIKIDENLIQCSVPGQPSFYTTVIGEPLSTKDNIKIYPDGYWYRHLVYAQEEEKELDYQEDLYSPCQVLAELSPGQEVALIFSKQKKQHINLERWIEQEVFIRRKEADDFSIQTPFARRCALAADQFIIHGESGYKIIRGYPWYEDTIREALMSLPGICLATGKFAVAKSILSSCAKLLYHGLLPARFHEEDLANADYNNMDASLWFIWAVQEYWEASQDAEFLKEMKPHIEHIIRAFREGIKMMGPKRQIEIWMDEDSLIRGNSTLSPLTWMDGRVNEWLATPRKGKPVEVQALWYNALQFCSEVYSKFESTDHGLSDLAKKTKENFNMLFWNAQNNYLYDVIEGNGREGSIRPNALFAISLPYEILDAEKFRPVVETAWRNLYTSLGLRTLSTAEPHFHGACRGDERNRAASMHNGTVAPFMIGPFLTAFFKTYGREHENKEDALHFLIPFVSHLSDAGLGTISEMFDGNSPYNPRGCIADARAVAEILRVMTEEGIEI